MKQKYFYYYFLLFLPFMNTTCYAVCGTLSAALTAPQSTIDFTTNIAPVASITINRTIKGPCSIFVGFSKGFSSTYTPRTLLNGSNSIAYQLYSDAAHTNVLMDAQNSTNSNNFISGIFSSTGTSITLSYYPLQNTTTGYEYFGTYNDTVSMNIYTGTIGGAYTLEGTGSITYKSIVSKKIDIAVVPTGQAFNISSTSQNFSFGSLNPTPPPQSADLIIKYNAGYGVNLCSANLGRMKHSTQSQYVPYAMTVNGAAVNFNTSCSSYAITGSGNSINGLRAPILITPSSAATASSGAYSDTITISVVTTE